MIYVGDEGHIHGTADGITMRQGDDNVVINHGEISAQLSAIYFQGGEASVYNHGSISSFGVGDSAIRFNSTADGSDIREVVNTGIISGAPQSTASVTNAIIQNSGGAEFHVNNSGTINGIGTTAIFSAAQENYIESSGLIIGDVFLTNVTVMSNSGTIDGNVYLSGSSDFYNGNGGGNVTGFMNLAGDNDLAYLGDGGGVLLAGFGDDTVRGGAGSDEISGQENNDDIRGRQGDDVLNGGSGNDTVRAGQGDDVLNGGSGNDFMRGGAGEDIIIGGLGADTMYGNGGADDFVYNSASESTNAGTTWDRIMDFTQGQDLIDLSAFNARFIGTGAYAANGNFAEVRTFEDPNGDTRVFVDVNADGVSNMRFYLVNTLGVTAADFIL